jgi:3-oxoacyl-[acyl-carrier-protein] synthase III
MILRFRNAKITGMQTVVPATEKYFLDEMKFFDFAESKSRKLMEVMGYEKHRIVDAETCVSDLAVFGFQKLFADGKLSREDIDALVVVTSSPDYLLPPTSYIIQDRIGLSQDVFCVDICQGCAGFVVGLMQAFMLLGQPSIGKVALVTGDVLSRKVSNRDRNSYPLTGDAVGITIVERSEEERDIIGSFMSDGSRHQALVIPAGGMRMPSSSETAILEDQGDGNYRSKDNLRMDGAGVFNFVQTEVPPMIEELLRSAGAAKDDIDFFLFHQPNRFMLEKLADKMAVPRDRIPNNIVGKFGNASSATIPTNVCYNLGNRMISEELKVCFAGFGVGLTWASLLMETGKYVFCDLIEYRGERTKK